MRLDDPANMNPKEREIWERKREAAKLMATYMPNAEIARVLATRWDCSTRTVHKIIHRVNKDWSKAAAKRNPEHELQQAIEARKQLIGRCIEVGDQSTALRAMDSLAKLEGLIDRAPVVGVNVNTVTVQAEPLTIEQINRIRLSAYGMAPRAELPVVVQGGADAARA